MKLVEYHNIHKIRHSIPPFFGGATEQDLMLLKQSKLCTKSRVFSLAAGIRSETGLINDLAILKFIAFLSEIP